MKLIIDIPNDTYKKIIADKYAIYDRMYYSIKNGIPFDKIRAEIEEAKKVRVTTDDAMIKASADVVINPQYRNFTSGLDMAINIINRY